MKRSFLCSVSVFGDHIFCSALIFGFIVNPAIGFDVIEKGPDTKAPKSRLEAGLRPIFSAVLVAPSGLLKFPVPQNFFNFSNFQNCFEKGVQLDLIYHHFISKSFCS